MAQMDDMQKTNAMDGGGGRRNRASIQAGPVRFELRHRDLMHDQGVCVQVMGEVDGKDTELLRFDCFDQTPHYHYAPSGRNERHDLDKTTAGNPIGWTMSQLRRNFGAMLKRAGAGELAEHVEAGELGVGATVQITPSARGEDWHGRYGEVTDTRLDDLDYKVALLGGSDRDYKWLRATSLELRLSREMKERLDEVEATAREMAASQRSTVTHNRGTEIIETGNIRFGLEFRQLSIGQGLAIHVLGDVAGQEVELLAFDCFDNNPHYHYGPRNKNIRLYWDQTIVPDTLRWTLDQFNSRRLPAMLERAGYPGVVAELDLDLIDATLPHIEDRAMAMVQANSQG